MKAGMGGGGQPVSRLLKEPHGFGTRASGLSAPYCPVVRPRQAHSAEVAALRDLKDAARLLDGRSVDGLVSDCPNAAVGVVTADCAPILVSGVKASGDKVVGAVHAGWRGALGGIIENTAKALKILGVVRWSAAVGPCAGAQSYEVDDVFRERALALRPDAEKFLKPAGGDKHMFDLAAWCAARLSECGADEVDVLGQDTIADGRFYSHRRATNEGRVEAGRQLSWIARA